MLCRGAAQLRPSNLMNRLGQQCRLLTAITLVAFLLAGTVVQAAHFNYRVIVPEMIGEDVYYLQSFLKQLGLYHGEVSERYDYDTQQALIHFQQWYQLPDTGWVDNNTANALLSAVNQQANLVVDGQYQLLAPPPVIANDLFYISIDTAVEILGIGKEVKNDRVRLRFRSEVWPITVADRDGLPFRDAAGWPTAREWHGSLYLPLRSLVGWVGASVSWDEATRTARIELPGGYLPYQASGEHYLRRISSISYPDRLRLVFHLSSTTRDDYTPRALTRDPFSGNWQAQLDGIAVAVDVQELALNDPSIRLVRLAQAHRSLTVTVTPSEGQQIASCEWLLDLEHGRMMLDMYRAQ
ncbi:MAG: peptidoglycan-binding protein [Bacillota bacterium]